MSDQEKADAARAAAQLVGDGQLVGLGTGTTVAHLLRLPLRNECFSDDSIGG